MTPPAPGGPRRHGQLPGAPAGEPRPSDAGLDRWVRAGSTVVLADGVGSPVGLCDELSEVARAVGDVRLILGWLPELPHGLQLDAFADVRSFLPGRALQPAIASGAVRYVPSYLSGVPALFATTWRPDLVVLSVRPTSHGLGLGSEVSWIAAAAGAARACVAELNAALPSAVRSDVLGGVDITVVAEVERPPVVVPSAPVDAVFEQIAAETVRYVAPGASLQVGPGALGQALVDALDVPVAFDSGIATDALVDLDARGLLAREPSATYLSGTERLYGWADGRPLLVGIGEERAGADDRSSVAVNGALAVDLLGQVAIDGPDARSAFGIGGHADYAYAANRSPAGLSIVAVPSRRRGRSTLVDHLAVPVSTPRSIVDVLVTEAGSVDLRGLSDHERSSAIASLFA